MFNNFLKQTARHFGIINLVLIALTFFVPKHSGAALALWTTMAAGWSVGVYCAYRGWTDDSDSTLHPFVLVLYVAFMCMIAADWVTWIMH